MGLLGQILGGLAGGVLGRSGGGLMGGGTSRVLMSLLPVVLGMLANRQGGGTAAGLGSALGGPGAGGMGGLGDLLSQLGQRGYGSQAASWVGTGPNEPIPPEALSEVLGHDRVAQIASQAGLSEDETRSGLAQLLPEVVDHFTPQGEVPAFDQLLSSIDDYQRQLPS